MTKLIRRAPLQLVQQHLPSWSIHFEVAPDSPSGLIWKVPTAPRHKVGDRAGWLDKTSGYWRVRLGPSTFMCHHVVLALTGSTPTPADTIADHLDRNPLNNRSSNLRWCSAATNNFNKATRNCSGFRFVDCLPSGRFRAHVKDPLTDKTLHLGTFDAPEDAQRAAVIYRLEHRWDPR